MGERTSFAWALDAWESQMFFLASHGYRCIVHDRDPQLYL
jgi:non-heme chloroperoxidase